VIHQVSITFTDFYIFSQSIVDSSNIMVAIRATSLFLGAGALVSAAPSSLDARASCTFSDAAAAIAGKASCTAIVIKDMTVPAGTTLDLTKLKTGTTVGSPLM
jgi:polygalacturonase